MPVRVITAPAEYPVTLAEAKTYLKAPASATEDALISGLIMSATRLFEQLSCRTIAAATLELTLNSFPAQIQLLEPPVDSVTSIKYTDADGAEQTLAASEYVLDNASNQRGWITPAVGSVWPVTQSGAINAVRVRYVAGFATAADVPEDIKLWIKAHVASWFMSREAETSVKLIAAPSLNGILNSYRVYHL